MKWSHLSAMAFVSLMAGCSSGEPGASSEGPMGSAKSALSADQCDYFDVNGKVRICHKTSSATHPYTVLNVSEQACVNAHTSHPGDYVAVNDPTCQGGGCLPEGAPVDSTLPCCDGLSAEGGICTAACPEGLTACQDGCVDLSSDNNNCGACGSVCVGTCIGGVCGPSFSRKRFKTEINYLDGAETARLHDELMRYHLATWRYKNQPEGTARHLGFMIDDVAPSASVAGLNGDQVDLYGYTSMAVAAIQAQDQQIKALQEEVKALRAQVEKKSPGRPAAK